MFQTSQHIDDGDVWQRRLEGQPSPLFLTYTCRQPSKKGNMLSFVTCDQASFLYRCRVKVVNGVLNTYGQWPMTRTTTSPLTTSELSRALSHANNSPFHYAVVIYRLIPAPPYCRIWVMQTMKAFENSGSHYRFIDPVTIFHCTCRFRLGTRLLLTVTTKGLNLRVSRLEWGLHWCLWSFFDLQWWSCC